ncbi:hypothetical protein GSI_13314 [Ganoderma sinense ZZ0214-1]|uniref:Uncharacterized protein n=1 Tax=Ganoderma sinense ZZ0214-1 TaxID=1077348 RepID=A0A2G8RVB4_9APHY|nr:hypothetical protein GSI_13314 [Ganoderma sinense ZZ0214-1]
MPPLVDSDSDTDSDVDPQEFDDDELQENEDDLLPEFQEPDPHSSEEHELGGVSRYIHDLESFDPRSRLLSDGDSGDDDETLPNLNPSDVEEEYDIEDEDEYVEDAPSSESDSEYLVMNVELGVTLHELLDNLLEGDYSEEGSSPPSPVPNQMTPEHQETDGGAASSSTSQPATTQREYHRRITGLPCDANGKILAAGAAPTTSAPASDDWAPYKDRLQFEVADLLYVEEQMSGGNIDKLLELWAASLLPGDPPFRNHSDMYQTIDSTPLGEVRWMRFEITHDAADSCPPDAPTWMTQSYEVWYRDVREVAMNIIGNPDFKDQIDYAPFRESDINGVRQLRDFMGGDWVWRQADEIAKDPNTHGAAFVPIILGSDKTTVSVATGQNEYYPLYASIGNIHNSARRAHRNGMVLVGFLAIPKTSRTYADDVHFRKFRRQLFHSSLSRILSSLKPGMTTPEVVRCGDKHFRKIIYGLGPYIADYPEQALLACIVQGWCPVCFADKTDLEDPEAKLRSRECTEDLVREHELGVLWDDYGVVGDVIPFTNDFPRADIHELLSPDILHQLIKGTFKDHLVAWVESYLIKKKGKKPALKILSDVDRRIAVVPAFSGLRRFPQGRGFKQWTGDDSKALMKVYLPAIVGYLPPNVVSAVRSFIEFCYLVRREVHTTHSISMLREALDEFHKKREAFRIAGVREEGFSLPRQHSCVHYEDKIQDFGAPNGLCSSITESMHIRAVKEPWRRSNRFEALGQMLISNQRLDKLAASRVQFKDRGMLEGSLLQSAQQKLLGPNAEPPTPARPSATVRRQNVPNDGYVGSEENNEDTIVDGPRVLSSVALSLTFQRNYPRVANDLGKAIGLSTLDQLIRLFLYHQLHPDSSETAIDDCPSLEFESIYVHHSAEVVFYAPSDPSGVGGMRREFIRAAPDWRKSGPRYDCVFLNRDSAQKGLLGLDVAQVKLLFTLCVGGRRYQCALVHWYQRDGDTPDKQTGMWIVKPSFSQISEPSEFGKELEGMQKQFEANSHIEVLTERHRMVQDQIVIQKRENADLLTRNQKLFDHSSNRSAMNVPSSGLRRRSGRAFKPGSSRKAVERSHPSDLMANVQKMHNDLERSGSTFDSLGGKEMKGAGVTNLGLHDEMQGDILFIAPRRLSTRTWAQAGSQDMRPQLSQERESVRPVTLQKDLEIRDQQGEIEKAGNEKKLSVYKRRASGVNGITSRANEDLSHEQQLEAEVAIGRYNRHEFGHSGKCAFDVDSAREMLIALAVRTASGVEILRQAVESGRFTAGGGHQHAEVVTDLLERRSHFSCKSRRSALKVAKADLATARSHVQEFQDIGQANDAALANLNATHDEYKAETEAETEAELEKLRLAEERSNEVTQQNGELQRSFDSERAVWVKDKELQGTILGQQRGAFDKEMADLKTRCKDLGEKINQLEPTKEQVRIAQADVEAENEQIKMLENESRRWQERNAQLLSKYDRIDPAGVQSLKNEIAQL